MIVELVYDGGCPNVAPARERLLQAFAKLRLTPRWTEWDSADPATPAHARGLGSPTILVDGVDVDAGPRNAGAPACRLYTGADGAASRVPALDHIVNAIRSGAPGSRLDRASLQIGLSVAPGIGLALVPKIICPVCWPLYTSVLASLGLSFVNYTPYLYPLTLGFLAAALVAIAAFAPTTGRIAPVTAGAAAAFAILAGKFHLHSDGLLYAGVLMLAGTAIWCVLRRRRTRAGACPRCTTDSLTHGG